MVLVFVLFNWASVLGGFLVWVSCGWVLVSCLWGFRLVAFLLY